MTAIQYLLMYIGFGMWFWAGYKVGINKEKHKQSKSE